MEIESYVRFLLALIFVLGLIGVLAAVARKYGLGYATPRGKRAGTRRLSISEVIPLDARRRLVLVRRDSTEHLIVLGPNGETVVERGIEAPAFSDALDETLEKKP